MTRRKLPALMLLSLWALLLIPVLVLCAIPVSDAAQAMLGLFAVLLVVVLKPFARSIVPRMALVGVASIVVLRYWFCASTPPARAWSMWPRRALGSPHPPHL